MIAPLSQILDHASRAVARLVAQFADSPLLKGMVSAIGDEVQNAENGLWGLLLTRDIENAESATLDAIGRLVGAPPRGPSTDEHYRNRIKAQVLANRSSGNASVVYQIAQRIIETWAVPGQPKINEDPSGKPGYTIGGATPGLITNNIDDARDLGRILDDVNPAGVRGIVLSQSTPAAAAFSFQHGPGLGFGHGAFVGAYDGGKKS